MRTQDCGNLVRIAALTGGDPAVAAQFLEDIAPTVWAACSLLTGNEEEAREAFLDTIAQLRAGNFAFLANYTGRGTLEDFVALKTRDLLGGRMLQLLQSDRQKGWRAFEALFKPDLLRLIHRRLPGARDDDARREAYQSICLAMVDSDYRRLKAYQGSGSFAGFVLRSADRLLIDFLRGLASRRRLPKAIARLPALDREVFKLIYWQHLPERADVLASYLSARVQPTPDGAGIAAALQRVKGFARRDQDVGRLVPISPDSSEFADTPDVSPETQLAQKQHDVELAAALDVLARAVETLPEAERLYLTIALSGEAMPPAREIARLMHRPVEEIYKLKQRVLRHLFDLIAEDSAVKNWRASV